MRKNENAVYINCPVQPRIAAELRSSAVRNGRPAGREGAYIITREIQRRIARRRAAATKEA